MRDLDKVGRPAQVTADRGAMRAADDLGRIGLTSLTWDDSELTSPDCTALFCALVDADDQGDPLALAQVGWVLFAIAVEAQHAHCEAVRMLGELRAAAAAAAADSASPGSLALLRHVLAKHGWLPPPTATPLQALAASLNTSRSARQ
jgi:hypothetical protein